MVSCRVKISFGKSEVTEVRLMWVVNVYYINVAKVFQGACFNQTEVLFEVEKT